jgi:hypothetical protein
MDEDLRWAIEELAAILPYVIPENYDRWQEVWSRVRAA